MTDRTSKDRFTWNDGDVVLKDAAGNEITRREALNQQYAELSAQVETTKSLDDLPEVDVDEVT